MTHEREGFCCVFTQTLYDTFRSRFVRQESVGHCGHEIETQDLSTSTVLDSGPIRSSLKTPHRSVRMFFFTRPGLRPRRPMTTARRRTQLVIEAMEDRVTPASYLVSNDLDDLNPGSLRWAITQANQNPGLDNITFDPTLGGSIAIGLGGFFFSSVAKLAGVLSLAFGTERVEAASRRFSRSPAICVACENALLSSDLAEEPRVTAFRGLLPTKLCSCEREQRRDAAATGSGNSSPLCPP